jgi:hypothetical protein
VAAEHHAATQQHWGRTIRRATRANTAALTSTFEARTLSAFPCLIVRTCRSKWSRMRIGSPSVNSLRSCSELRVSQSCAAVGAYRLNQHVYVCIRPTDPLSKSDVMGIVLVAKRIDRGCRSIHANDTFRCIHTVLSGRKKSFDTR